MEDSLEPGIYQHYKGALYQVIEVCRHSETLELMVIYRALYGTYGLWVRPIAMFHEAVIINGTTVPRFTFLHKCSVTKPELCH